MSTYLQPTETDYPTTGLTRQRRAELWRQFTAHLIGLAGVIWWMVFKEAPPK